MPPDQQDRDRPDPQVNATLLVAHRLGEIVEQLRLANHIQSIREDLKAMEQRLTVLIKNNAGNRPPRVRFEWAVGPVTNKTPAENTQMDIKITNEQKVTVTLSPKTDTGKPASLDGSPAWTVISGNSTVTVSEDGLSAVLTSSDDPGDTQIIVKADADLGEGIEEISEIINLSVIGATAKNLGITVGTPEPK